VVVPDVLGNQLLTVNNSCWDIGSDELTQSHSVGLRLELEVETVVHFLNTQTLLSCVVFDDQLLQEEEGPLVVHSLSDLGHSHPGMGRVRLAAVLALQVHKNVFNNKTLLQKSSVHNLLLDSELHFEPLGMGLRVDKACIDQFDVLHSLELLQANGEELGRLKFASNPGGSHVSVAVSAVLDDQVLGDAFGDIDLGFEAIHASVRLVRDHVDSAHAASDFVGFEQGRIQVCLVVCDVGRLCPEDS
jgi:hypothetical protein